MKSTTRKTTKANTNKKKPLGIRAKQVAARKTKVLKALEASLGIVTKACKNAGLDRSTFYKYINEDDEFAAKVQDIEDVALDFVEDKLLTNIKNYDTTATIFYLKTKGKRRGYVEKIEVDMNDKTVSETTKFSLKKVV